MDAPASLVILGKEREGGKSKRMREREKEGEGEMMGERYIGPGNKRQVGQ